MRLISEEVKNLKQLASEGFVPGSKATELERNRSELLAAISSTTSEISKARSALSEARLKIVQEKSAFAKEVDRELSEIQKSRKAFKLKLRRLSMAWLLACRCSPKVALSRAAKP